MTGWMHHPTVGTGLTWAFVAVLLFYEWAPGWLNLCWSSLAMSDSPQGW